MCLFYFMGSSGDVKMFCNPPKQNILLFGDKNGILIVVFCYETERKNKWIRRK